MEIEELENPITTEDIKKPHQWNKKIYFITSIGALCYICIYGLLLYFSVKDIQKTLNTQDILLLNDTPFPSLSYQHTWLDAFFHDLGANGLGDALAGVFAPPAFAFLAITVVLQTLQLKSQQADLKVQHLEMKLQREEMMKQREEMDENQILMQKQIEASEAQTIATTRQANILENQLNRQVIIDADNNIDDWIMHLVDNTVFHDALKIKFDDKLRSFKSHRLSSHKENFSRYQKLEALILQLNIFNEQSTKANIIIGNLDAWEKLSQQADILTKHMNQCSEAKKIFCEQHKIIEMITEIHEIYQRLVESKQKAEAQ